MILCLIVEVETVEIDGFFVSFHYIKKKWLWKKGKLDYQTMFRINIS